MDADLARELREATDQLLDVVRPQPPAFPASPHLQQLPLPAKANWTSLPPSKPPVFSPTSKLELLHSPTDVRPWQWPTPPSTATDTDAPRSPSPSAQRANREPIKIKLSADVVDDADDNLPARGLSSRIGSVIGASHSHDAPPRAMLSAFATEDEHRAASPSKLRVRTPVNDIYINQYGERVVQGKVVGRVLGGRPRPPSLTSPTLHSTSAPTTEAETSPEASRDSSLPALTRSSHTTVSDAGRNATSPPAFFLESFPNAFAPPAPPASSVPATKNRPRRSSKGGPPNMLKAPRAVAGALTLAHSDSTDDAVLVRDASFHTASEIGSPASSSSKQLSPPPPRVMASAEAEMDAAFGKVQLDAPEPARRSATSTPLLSPNQGVGTSDTTRGKLELDSFRRPTPTIELSQAKSEPVKLHANRRQARASGVVTPPAAATEEASEGHTLEHIEPPRHVRHGSASEPTSPLMSPRHMDNDDVDGADDAASLESAPSSLISLPVSTHTTSSRTPSHTSLERRRSGGSVSSPSRRRSVRRSEGDERFAREVRIRGWSEVGSQARGWVVFEIVVTTTHGTHIVAHKRFSSFVNLHRALAHEWPQHAKWLPKLPTRTTGLLSKYDARYLEKRRTALQRWLDAVMLDRVWGTAEALREWVLASD